MTVHFAKITSKAQTTVPADVRKALNVKPGDTLAYRVGPNGVTVSKAEPLDWRYLASLETTLSEWNAAEDGAAFDDLGAGRRCRRAFSIQQYPGRQTPAGSGRVRCGDE